MERRIRFKFSAEKARAAILWMIEQKPGIDLHTMLKACYFADRKHLNEYGRPVFGATYRAMKFGPVPIEIYEMAKSEALWLAELGREKFPWELRGYNLVVVENEPVDLDVFSESDFAALQDGFSTSTSMGFNARTAATHGEDWQKANLGIMRYEDMIEDSPTKENRVAYLRETAPFIRL